MPNYGNLAKKVESLWTLFLQDLKNYKTLYCKKENNVVNDGPTQPA